MKYLLTITICSLFLSLCQFGCVTDHPVSVESALKSSVYLVEENAQGIESITIENNYIKIVERKVIPPTTSGTSINGKRYFNMDPVQQTPTIVFLKYAKNADTLIVEDNRYRLFQKENEIYLQFKGEIGLRGKKLTKYEAELDPI